MSSNGVGEASGKINADLQPENASKHGCYMYADRYGYENTDIIIFLSQATPSSSMRPLTMKRKKK